MAYSSLSTASSSGHIDACLASTDSVYRNLHKNIVAERGETQHDRPLRELGDWP